MILVLSIRLSYYKIGKNSLSNIIRVRIMSLRLRKGGVKKV